MKQNPIATILLAGGREIVAELYPEDAPNTVASFIWLAKRGCFDHHAIERVVPGWVLDVSYTAFGNEECKYLIANESRSRGFSNNLSMDIGTIAMGGYGPDGIAGGEFFFPFTHDERLDGHYPAFGKVVRGLEEILRIERVELRPVPNDLGVKINVPINPEIIEQVRVETFGVLYPEPVRLKGHALPENWR